jgi:hypothetical protein
MSLAESGMIDEIVEEGAGVRLGKPNFVLMAPPLPKTMSLKIMLWMRTISSHMHFPSVEMASPRPTTNERIVVQVGYCSIGYNNNNHLLIVLFSERNFQLL